MESNFPPLTNFQGLLDLLSHDNIQGQVDHEERSVRIALELFGQLHVQLIRWMDNDQIVQFVQSVLGEVPPERAPAVESGIVRLNHALAVPGFDFSHEQGLVSFRLYLSLVPRGHLLAEEVRAMFQLAVRNAAMFHPTLQRIVAGESFPETIVADAQGDLASFRG